jgi:hypothetical protein
MIVTMSVPLFERLKTLDAVRASPSFFGWKSGKARGQKLLAGTRDHILLFAAAIWAFVPVCRYMMADKTSLRVVYRSWQRTKRTGRYFLTLTLFLPMACKGALCFELLVTCETEWFQHRESMRRV